jgi:methionine-rich copper-binding protein CopC
MKKIFMVLILFSLFLTSRAFSHTGLVYSYPAVNNFNECKSKATTALRQAGYATNITAGGNITIGSRSNIKANIACAVASRNGVAFIIITAPLGVNLATELRTVNRNFSLAK